MKRITFSVLSVLMLITMALPATSPPVMAGECTETETIYTTHTAWVDSENPTQENYDQSKLHTRAKEPGDHGELKVRRTYLYSEDIHAGSVYSAKLYITGTTHDSAELGVYSTSWDGTPISWNTAPPPGTFITSENVTSPGGAVFDITGAVSAGEPLSLVLKMVDDTPTSTLHIDLENPYIEITYQYPLPKADFYASDTQPCAGTEIDFYDDSTGTYDTWFWDFGDGGTSTATRTRLTPTPAPATTPSA